MLFEIQKQLEKDLEKKDKEIEQSSYLYSLYQDNEFLERFEGFIVSSLPQRIPKKDITGVFGRHIKTVYKKLVQERGWPEKKFTIMLWNVAERNLKPFETESYISLEKDYNTCNLRLPYGWKWIDEDIISTLGGDDFWI